MANPSNNKQIVGMSIGAVAGGVIGGLCGIFVLTPAVLIPIGVVIGIAVSLPMVNKRA